MKRTLKSFILVTCLLPGVKLCSAIVPVGLGSYTTALPAGSIPPSDVTDVPVELPFVTANFTASGKPVKTTQWWTPIVWKWESGAPEHGLAMYPRPLNIRAYNDGLALGWNQAFFTTAVVYRFPFVEDLRAGVVGLNSTASRLEDYGDWHVVAEWDDGVRRMLATSGSGFPFAYFHDISGGDALVTFPGAPVILSNIGGALHVQYNGRTYGVYGPTGSAWVPAGNTFTNTLAGADYFSVATLPDATPATFNDYHAHAYALPTSTTMTFNYTQATSQVDSTYTTGTTILEGAEGRMLQALHYHQWRNSSSVNTAYVYSPTPRGDMQVVRGNVFTTSQKFPGVLPSLAQPVGGTYNPATMYSMIDCMYVSDLYTDTCGGRLVRQQNDNYYWTGKDLGKISQLVWIAHEIGHQPARDMFLKELKETIALMLDSTDTRLVWHLDPNWGSLYYNPSSGFQEDSDLNDKQLQNGYYFRAAATIAHFDPAWLAPANWGGMMELIMKDTYNWDRTDTAWPYLRAFDIYAGHAWASGHGGFGDNNNQESTSEAMQTSAAMIFYGELTGNTQLRDTGIWLYTTEVNTTEQYWFDRDSAVFPVGFAPENVGLVWGTGGDYATWFGGLPALGEYITGINVLPVWGASTYLGRSPANVLSVYNYLVAQNGGPPDDWEDILWNYRALTDPVAALADHNAAGAWIPEDGNSKAFSYHWLHNLVCLGQVDETINADWPYYQVFDNAGVKSYVGYNPTASTVLITFSNAATLSVPAGQIVSTGGCDSAAVPLPTPTVCVPGPLPTVFHLVDDQIGEVLPADPTHFGRRMQDWNTGAAGFTPVQITDNGPWTFYTLPLTGDYNAGNYDLILWTNNAGGVSNVRVDLDIVDYDGTNPLALANTTVNVHAIPGNHPNTFNFGALGMQSLSNQRFRITITYMGGGGVPNTMVYNGGVDFDSRLNVPTGNSVCETPTSTPTHSPTPTATPTATQSSTATQSPSATPSYTPTSTSTPSPSPSATASASPTTTLASTFTTTATPSASPSPTTSPTPSLGSLECNLTLSPSVVCLNQLVTVLMSVSNTGSGPVNSISPSALIQSGTGGAFPISGPNPASFDLGVGSMNVFTWTYSAVGAGTLDLSGNSNGTDAGTGSPVLSAQCTTNILTIEAPADLVILSSSLSPPNIDFCSPNFELIITVMNIGENTATGVSINPPAKAGTASPDPLVGPAPASVILTSGASQAFTFSGSVSVPGAGPDPWSLAYNAAATGTGACDGNPLMSSAVMSNSISHNNLFCSPTVTPTSTASPSATSSASPSSTTTPVYSATASPSATPTYTHSPSPTNTITSTWTPTSSPSHSSTFTFTSTRTATPSATASATLTASATQTPYLSPTASPSVSPTLTPYFYNQEKLIKVRGLYPNPFSEDLKVYYTLRVAAVITFTVYNVAGEVIYITETKGSAGNNIFVWDGINNATRRCASGIYPFRLEAVGVDGSQDGFWERAAIVR